MTAVAPVGSRSARVQRDGRTLAFVWLVTLSLSSFPAITAVELTGLAPLAAHRVTFGAAPALAAVA
jgi:hypothetical protein